MAMRKLVQLDDETWGWSEIDLVKLKRVASEFKAWLIKQDPNNDPHGFIERDLPIVDAALRGELSLPLKRVFPHSREIGEGMLPREYTEIAAPFYNTIRGEHLVPPDIIEKDGKRYAWAEFEEE